MKSIEALFAIIAIVFGPALLACALSTSATIPAAITPTLILPTSTAPATIPAVLPMRAVMATATPAAHTCTVISESLTVRACGSVDCKALDWLKHGDVITTTQAISGWVWIGTGWINSSFCKEQTK